MAGNAQKILDSATTNQTSKLARNLTGSRTIQAAITGSGVLAAVVSWYGSNSSELSNGVLVATTTISDTVTASGLPYYGEWPFMYAVLSGISGTNAAVTATIGS
jgi:hypothetical protein